MPIPTAPVDDVPWPLLAGCAVCCCVFLHTLWIWQRSHRDGGIADVGWALGLAGCALIYAAFGTGAATQRVALAIAAGGWAVRLGSFLLLDRIVRAAAEDGRYQAMRAAWGDAADRHFLWFFQAQALLAATLSIPWLLWSSTPATTLAPIQWAGLLLVAVGVAGESLADRQLARFRGDVTNRGRTCRVGLWRVSRHPNYFFEWLVWCGFALCAWPAPHGPYAALAPALMLLFVTKWTGIPWTEARALKSRGEDYRRYQRETSPFFPWFPKSAEG